MAIFGSKSVVSSSSKSYIKLVWVRHIRDTQSLDTWEFVQRYVRCHIFYLLGTTLFTDNSTAYAYPKYLPLLQNFEQIALTIGGQQLSHVFTGHCTVHRAMIARRWVARLIYYLFEHGSKCPFLRPFQDSSLHRLIYWLHAGNNT
ncbi:hypothetical protein Ahy_B04g070296 [Arachis hypogaea]|uniref:Aminotransferase-like plant mobile domain-containing protein n=1 Tax=Arachis hypogaea TaxID=3818 RepID=A0A444ZGA8_ARAHY|nr:hypothetical protein Ahy_B04g070296 [Arachis hypogaea]